MTGSAEGTASSGSPSQQEVMTATPTSEAELRAAAREAQVQSYVDRLSPKVEHESARLLKAVQVERRLAAACPQIELPEELRKRAIALARELLEQRLLERRGRSSAWVVPSKDVQRDKFLIGIGTIFRSLRQMKFKVEQIVECLRIIQNPSLEEALQWVCYSFLSFLIL